MLDPAPDRTAGANHLAIPTPIATAVRPLDETLWSLLLRPGPLSAAEWTIIEAHERAWQETQHADLPAS